MDLEIAKVHIREEASPMKKLSFSNIDYFVKVDDQEKQILKHVNGVVKSGEMLCILGPSGSGKTSLIQILAGRIKTTKSSHRVTGSVLVNDEELSSTAFRRLSGLVTQEDVFEGCLTVEETIKFKAALMLRHSNEARMTRVNEVIDSLQLNNCRETYIGDDSNPYLKGISGGEKRRLAIAIEILDPSISILIADEPTSGLDAASAQAVINLLRTLADKGMTVLTTLHQPRVQIMSKFDLLMIMSHGRSIYNNSVDIYTKYLIDNLRIEIPLHENPYDLLLDALNPAIADSSVKIGVIPDEFTGDIGDFLADFLDNLKTYDSTLVNASYESILSKDANNASNTIDFLRWLEITWTLFHRTALIKLRDPICLATQISSAILMGIIFGILYYDVYNKSTISFSLLDSQMCIAMTVLMVVWLPYDVTLTFPKERRIFLRERKAGLYTTSSFYFARICSDFPAHVVSAIIMAIIVHSMAQLRIALGAFILLCIAGITVGAAIMQTTGAMARTCK